MRFDSLYKNGFVSLNNPIKKLKFFSGLSLTLEFKVWKKNPRTKDAIFSFSVDKQIFENNY